MKPSKKYNFSMARSNTYTIYLSRPLASLARFSLSKCSLMASPCNWRLGRGSYGRTALALKPKTQAHRPKKGNEAPQIGSPAFHEASAYTQSPQTRILVRAWRVRVLRSEWIWVRRSSSFLRRTIASQHDCNDRSTTLNPWHRHHHRRHHHRHRHGS